jgi:hypothetical protein
MTGEFGIVQISDIDRDPDTIPPAMMFSTSLDRDRSRCTTFDNLADSAAFSRLAPQH